MNELKYKFAERIDRLVFHIDQLDQSVDKKSKSNNEGDVLAALKRQGYYIIQLLSKHQCDEILKVANIPHELNDKDIEHKSDGDVELKPFIVEHTRNGFPHKGNEVFENPWVS